MFITQPEIQDTCWIISESHVLQHAKVLRLQVDETFVVQAIYTDHVIRYTCNCKSITKKEIHFDIVSHETRSGIHDHPTVIMAVPVPNTLSKVDLIVQKLTEIWVDEIVFRVADRSQIRSLSDKKMSKICQISLHASEQAKNRHIPMISFVKDISAYTKNEATHVYILDQGGVCMYDLFDSSSKVYTSLSQKNISQHLVIVWPEWWLTHQDYTMMWVQEDLYTMLDLWESILRMETAAWVWAWTVQQLSRNMCVKTL